MEKKTTIKIDLNTNDMVIANALVKKMLSVLDAKELDFIEDCNMSQTIIDMSSEAFDEIHTKSD